jgi:hypothetical protein
MVAIRPMRIKFAMPRPHPNGVHARGAYRLSLVLGVMRIDGRSGAPSWPEACPLDDEQRKDVVEHVKHVLAHEWAGEHEHALVRDGWTTLPRGQDMLVGIQGANGGVVMGVVPPTI